MYDLEKLRKNSESVSEYIINSSKETTAFIERARKYRLDKIVTKKLAKFKNDVSVFVFSAEWCPDCHRNVPVLYLISKSAEIEVKVFGHLLRDLKKPKGYWKIPPSPPEVEEFAIRRIPSIIVLNNEGKEIGKIIENPPKGNTLEKALLDIIESRLSS